MEIHYSNDERIIATTIPSFSAKKDRIQMQIRISENGKVEKRAWFVSNREMEEQSTHTGSISPGRVKELSAMLISLADRATEFSVKDDAGARSLTYWHPDGVLKSVTLFDGTGRKRPTTKEFNALWSAIEATALGESEQIACVEPDKLAGARFPVPQH